MYGIVVPIPTIKRESYIIAPTYYGIMFYLPDVMALDICYMILIILDNELLALIMNLQKESTIKVNIMPMNERTLNKKKINNQQEFSRKWSCLPYAYVEWHYLLDLKLEEWAYDKNTRYSWLFASNTRWAISVNIWNHWNGLK